MPARDEAVARKTTGRRRGGRALRRHDAEAREIRGWEEFVQIAGAFEQGSTFGGRYAFRGHANEAWGLETSLARVLRGRAAAPAAALDIERNAVQAFQTEAHLYVPPRIIPDVDDVPSYWTVMQHYGAPTRLLDWTRSPYVAAYFAVEPLSSDDGAVWVLDVWALHAAMLDRYPQAYPLSDEPQARAKILMSATPPPIVYVTDLRFHTDRMAAQQLLFTLSPQVLANHGDLISAALAEAGPGTWQKLIVRAELKADFMQRLRTMNITARSLFPGLDGFGRSVGELIRLEAERGPRPPAPRRLSRL